LATFVSVQQKERMREKKIKRQAGKQLLTIILQQNLDFLLLLLFIL